MDSKWINDEFTNCSKKNPLVLKSNLTWQIVLTSVFKMKTND